MNTIQFLVKSTIFSFLLILSLISCNDSKPSEAEPKAATEKPQKKAANNGTKSYCFQNEYSHADSNEKDVVELSVELNGKSATGTYNWLPAFKDQRKGKFRGMMENDVIKGEYSFVQEGTKETTRLEITLNETVAIVKGFDRELGLDNRIKKVECGN